LNFLSKSIPDFYPSSIPSSETVQTIGVLTGEGIGTEVIDAALKVLDVVSSSLGKSFEIKKGGTIGNESHHQNGKYLSDEVINFCKNIFRKGGAVLCGPGGGRFVYEMRSYFDLYCKFTPLKPLPVLNDSGILRSENTKSVDIIAVRENTSGLYFGSWSREANNQGKQKAIHNISYDDHEVDRILKVAINLAKSRRGKLALTLKSHGMLAISQFWEERARQLLPDEIELEVLQIDNAVYQLIANAQNFDVVVSPNMFGDVFADCGALLLGYRGMSFSGNFGSGKKAVYQTGHGAALDIAGTDTANPIGQIMSLAMMLRESFHWPEGADAIEHAILETLSQGYRTIDIASSDSEILGTGAMTEKICQTLQTFSFVEK